jgi:LysR family hydrogen peroxide-inducible transcriptional activator
MNFRDLHYLIAVAEHLSFNRAAEICHVSQPSLSMQVQKVEEELGLKIFERTNRKVMVTPEGLQLLAHARRILEEQRSMKELANTLSDPFSGNFRLGMIPTIAPYALPWMLPLLQQHFPRLALQVTEVQTLRQLEMLRSGELDASLIALPSGEPELEEMEIYQEPFLLAVAETHPLARQKTIAYENLKGEEIMLLEDGHCFRSQALEVCGLAGARENAHIRATSLETLCQLAATGAGITLVPEQMTRRPTAMGLHFIPFREPVPARHVGLVWRKSTVRKRLLTEMVTLFRQGKTIA